MRLMELELMRCPSASSCHCLCAQTLEESGRDSAKFDHLMPTIVKPITPDTYVSSVDYTARSVLYSVLSVGVFVRGWVCYHNNWKLRASILTKHGLWIKVVTISS